MSTGLYILTVIMFGLCNAPATFQKFVNEIFAKEITDGIVVIYLDNILIFFETEEDHERDVTRVFEILDKYDLFLRPSKCEFNIDTVKFLGHIIEKGEVKADPAKIESVKNWPIPKNVKQLQ